MNVLFFPRSREEQHDDAEDGSRRETDRSDH
jgi:hypothetical protein